jgi:crossover junction endodeoxyribonuclease RuvC
MMILGVDPGKDGACACIVDGKLESVDSFRDLTTFSLAGVLRQARYAAWTFVEEVHASPQQGVVSAFTFGKGYGAILGALYVQGVNVKLVRPVEWQGALGCLSQGNKKSLFEFAKKLYPVEYAGGMFKAAQADAVLIAHYGMKFMQYNTKPELPGGAG